MNGTRINTELMVAIVIAAIFLFFSVNFSPQILGMIFFGMVVVYYIFAERFPTKFSKIAENREAIIKGLLPAIGLLIVWLAASNYIFSVFQVPEIQTESVVATLAAYTTPPIISEVPMLRFFVFGILIPIAETFFFFGLFVPFIISALRVRIGDRFNVSWIIVALIAASVMGIFHLTTHIALEYALITDFIFAFISGMLVLYYKRLNEAMLLHIIANSVIIASQLGWLHI